MQKKVVVILAVCILLLIVVSLAFKISQKPIVVKAINNFDDCLKAGNSIMESWPRQCRTLDGRNFTEDISGLNGAVSFVTAEIKKESPDYTVNVNYPVLTMPDANKAMNINKRIKELADNQANAFIKDITPREADQVASFMESDYRFYLISENFISLNLNFSTYYSGAAHPMTYSVPFNYEVDRDKELFLDEIFKPSADYLKYIADYCQLDLADKLGADLFNEGLSQDKVNFSLFVLNPESIIFLFDPYQVASYAAGPQQTEVFYYQLTDVINEQGAIPRLVGDEKWQNIINRN